MARHKTLYNRWKRWSDRGIFALMMSGLAAHHSEESIVIIDATYFKAHRTATSLRVKKGGRAPGWPYQRRYEHQGARGLRQQRPTDQPVCDRLSGQRKSCRKSQISGRKEHKTPRAFNGIATF